MKKIMKPFFMIIVYILVHWVYRLKVNGQNTRVEGRKIYIANHTSLLDALFLATLINPCPDFIMFKGMAQYKPFWDCVSKSGFVKGISQYIMNKIILISIQYVNVFLVDERSPYVLREIIRKVESGTDIMIFPEGRITTTTGLMKIYDGAGYIADKTKATLIPLYIDGLLPSKFSYTKKYFKGSSDGVTISWGKPFNICVDEDLTLRQRKEEYVKQVEDVMVRMQCENTTIYPIYRKIIDAVSLHGKYTNIIDDHSRSPITYSFLLKSSKILGRKLEPILDNNVTGVMLPNSIGATVVMTALFGIKKVFHVINMTSDVNSICNTIGIKNILTSRAFVEKAKLEKLISRLIDVNIIYLEDIKETITWKDKLCGILMNEKKLPGYSCDINETAVIMATSGSEGAPKGVVLSHKNIIFNCEQIRSVIDFNSSDKVFNAMPVFHSLGLIDGFILPLINGIASIQYPSPLHFRIIPLMIYNTGATIAFGTDTFLKKWAKYANSYDFHTLRFMIAGAEKIQSDTIKLYSEKFGVRILEGYGATETSPVLALNTPKYNEQGTTGRILPCMEYKLNHIPGLGDELIVYGENIMKGYMKADKPLMVQDSHGEYDTGDIVSIDSNGFISIKGRSKRFVKIGGERLSMAFVEGILNKVWPSESNAVINVEDAMKGEKMIAFTTRTDAETKEIRSYARDNSIPEITVPREVIVIDKIPLLGTGKINYPALKGIYNEQKP